MPRLLLFLGLVVLAILAPHAYGAMPLAPADLRAFQLLAPHLGWVWLADDLFWTRDDGQTWTRLTPPHAPNARILAVHFLDAWHGWVLLVEPNATFTLARTHDGGATWQTQPLALFEPNDPNALVHAAHFHFLDAQTGWLAFERATSSNFSVGALFHTTDGGASWHARTLPIGAPVVFADTRRGWTAGGATGDVLYRTTDGGLTWSPEPFAATRRAPNRRLAIPLPRFENATNGVIPILITEDGITRVELYRTQDAGAMWQRVATLPLDRTIEVGEHIPLATVDAQTTFVITPRARQIAQIKPGETTRRAGNDSFLEGIVALQMASSTSGWAKHVSGACVAESPDKTRMRCQSEARLLRTSDGGATWQPLALPAAAKGHVPSGGTQIVQGQGFDKCEVPTLAQLQTWWNSSPYRVVNLYIGGSNRACANTALSNTYVSQLSAQGWTFIPTWVGPQAACSGYPARMSSDPATAYMQGVNEANSAAEVAAALGLSNSVLYYDLEGYNTSDSACRNAAKSFISGWSAQARVRGYQAGVYGSACASALDDFSSIPNVPNVIWPAHWIYGSYTSNASVWGVACIPDTHWSNHQRIRQYAGGHNETWGGLTLTIDSNVLDGVVATYGTAPTCSYDSNQIVLYEHAHYTGNCKTLGMGEYPNPGAMGFANDTASSIRVGSNVKAILCKDDNYAGGCETFTGDDPDFGDNSIGHDTVSSVQVQSRSSGCSYDSNQIVLYANTGYGGTCKTLGIGDYPNPSAMGFANDDAESVRIGSNVQALLCRDDNYGGGCVTLTADTDNLDSTSLGRNQLSSVRVQTRANTAWHVEYFSDKNLGNRCYEGWENSTYIFKKWDWNAPAASCPTDNFSARFTRQVNFSGGDYAFHLEHDDGARLFIDGQNLINAWWDGGGRHDGVRHLVGTHEVTIEYYDQSGFAGLEAWWRGAGFLPNPPSFDPYQWHAEYFGNRDLWGMPPLVQNEGSGFLDHHWGGGGAGYGMPSDNFSARFQRTVGLECGRYRFNLHVDDGVRVWIGNTLILDAWRDQVADYAPEVDVAAGAAVIRVEYYEHGGGAVIQMSWTKMSGCVPATPTGLTVSGATSNSLTLTWNDVADETGYRIYRWGYNGSQWAFLYHASVGANVTTFTDHGLNAASDYYYELSAYNANGESAHTTWTKGTTLPVRYFLPFIRR